MKSFALRMLSRAAVLVMLAASTHHSAAVAAQLEGATLADTLKAGDKTLELNGLGLRKKAMFEGKGFADAGFSIWLGPKPPSEDLRKGMLG